MAGVTSFPFKPSSTPTLTPTSTKPHSYLFSSSSSCSSSTRLLLKLASRPVAPRCHVRPEGLMTVVARYGRGGGGYRPGPRPGGSRRSPGDARGGFDSDDEALNLSRITDSKTPLFTSFVPSFSAPALLCGRSTSVRLIDEQQNMVGIVSKSEAIQMAEVAERDLVILSPDADPPVLRIMDYNKYKYEQQKKKRDQQKKSAASRMDIKELKMGYNIDSHDYSVRLKAAQKFLNEGDKVKIIVNLKGRENEFRSIAIELIKRFQTDVGELATEESKNFNDRNVFMVLVPNKTVMQKPQEQPKKTPSKVSANV